MASPESSALYDDGLVRLDSQGVRLARYYFPLARPRRIAWSELRGYEVRPMTTWAGRYRAWGTHRLDWWFQLDTRRRHKDRLIVLDVPGTKPVVTPDDVDTVCRVIDRQLADRP